MRAQSRPGYGPDPESVLQVAEHFLRHRQFNDCQMYALHAQQSDPNLPGLPQILAVANVLLASQTRPDDYYSILNLTPFCPDRNLLAESFKTLTSLLNPNKNHYPFADEAYELVRSAWSVLSDPMKKTQFDNLLKNGYENRNGEKGAHSCANSGKVDTFWTACPYCYYVYEYAKVYEDCNLRCSNMKCRKGFRGLAINRPPVNVLNEGKYSRRWTPFAPVKADLNQGGGGNVCGTDNFVEISDDSENSCDGEKFDKSSEKMETRKVNEQPVLKQGLKRKKKSVGKNTTKVMGTGNRVKKLECVAQRAEGSNGTGNRVKKQECVAQSAEGLDLNSPAISGEVVHDGKEDTVLGFVKEIKMVNGGELVSGEVQFFDGDDDIFEGLDGI